jgi:hypothetical protein
VVLLKEFSERPTKKKSKEKETPQKKTPQNSTELSKYVWQ